MAAEENQTKQHHQVEKPSSPRNTSGVNTLKYIKSQKYS